MLAWSDHHYSVFKGWVGCFGVSYQLTGGARRNFGSILSKGKVESSVYNLTIKTRLAMVSQSVLSMDFIPSLAMASWSCLLIFFDGQSKGSSNPIIHLWLGLGTHWNLVPFPWPPLAAYFCTGPNTPHHTWSCWAAPHGSEVEKPPKPKATAAFLLVSALACSAQWIPLRVKSPK